MGGSAAARPETENTISKYKTIKVCLLYTVVISKSKCLLFLLPRERRSVSANAHNETKKTFNRIKYGRFIAAIQKLAEETRRLKQAQSNPSESNSAAAPTNQQAKTKVPAKTKDDIGVINSDRCKRCEPLIGEEVCGANGKTYVSLCHAVNCAGLRESDITASRCVEEVN